MRNSLLFVLSVAAFILMSYAGSTIYAQDQIDEKSESGEFPITQEELALLAKEPPLTQADIEVVIKMADAPDSEDAKIMKDSGISEFRLNLVMTKISFGILMLSSMDAEAIGLDGIHEAFIPNPEELDLIKANLNRIAGSDESANDASPKAADSPGGKEVAI